MKITKQTVYWILILLMIELIILLSTIFVLNLKYISNIFFGIAAILMIGYVYQFFQFKSLNSANSRNKIKPSDNDVRLLNKHHGNNKVKLSKNGKPSQHDVVRIRKIEGYIFMLTITIPIIVAAIIAIVSGYAFQ